MRRIAFLFALAASAATAIAQTPATPATKAATTSAKPAVKKPVPAPSTLVKLPVTPPVGPPHLVGRPKPAFTLFYQDIKLGTGAEAEPNKVYEVKYTGWRAADGVKFDSSEDHRQPVMDKDGKPVNGPDGKPKTGDPTPFKFPQGQGRLIPGWDQGFGGMKVGGKRRLFIPWQLAYGTRDIAARGTDHPGIPPKSDLIFDVELVSVSDMPARPAGMPGGMPGGRPMPGRPGAPPTGMAPLPQRPPAPATPAPTAPAPTAPAPATPAPATPAPATPAPTPAPATPSAPAPAPTTPPPSK